MTAFFNNPEMLRNARIHSRTSSWTSDVSGRVCRVQEMAHRPERLYSRISSGEVT
jgi:hypothetical protein